VHADAIKKEFLFYEFLLEIVKAVAVSEMEDFSLLNKTSIAREIFVPIAPMKPLRFFVI
jgi:hypothetical protein